MVNVIPASTFAIDVPDALLAGARRGEAEAYEQLYRLFERPVYTLALRLTGQREEAQDILQETMLKLFDRLSAFRGDSPFWGWLPDVAPASGYAGRWPSVSAVQTLSTLRDSPAELLQALREPRDEILLELGADGEVLLARLRLVIAVVLILLPALNHFTGGASFDSLAALAGVGLAVLLSQVWLTMARQRRRYLWLPFASACFDVTMVSLVLLLLAFTSPAAGLNNVVVWSCYPLAILATALRTDVRVTIAAGGLAVLEFLAISAFFMAIADGPISSPDYGTVHLAGQVQRAVLLAAATLVTSLVVFRMQRLVRISGTDGLTGLPNRSFLNHRVPLIIAEARSEGETLCLALIDLDFFKRINDELGHQAGDRALRHIVDTLRMELRREEPLLRVGGEEFVLVLRQPVGAAWERMELLRRKLEGAPFLPEEGAEPRRLTFSAGMACCPSDAVDVSSLMRCADLRLRAAKLGGRNRVVARDTQ